jgi:hypothetical protein
MNMSLVLAVISLAFCVAFFFYFRRYIDRKTSVDRLLSDYRTEVYRLIGEIDAVTDRNLRLVEDSVKTLKQLLEDTDKRISVYTRELERSRQGEALYTSLGRGIRAALDSEPPAAPPPAVRPPQETPSPQGTLFPQETPKAPASGAKERRPKKAGTKPPPTDVPAQSASKRKLKVRIAEMSARGLAPHEIASRLNLSLTEVDLALNLLQRPNG